MTMNEQQEIKYAQTIRNQRVDLFLKVARGLEDLDLSDAETRRTYLSYGDQVEKTALWTFEVEAFLNRSLPHLAFTRVQTGGTYGVYLQSAPMMTGVPMQNHMSTVPVSSNYPNPSSGYVSSVPPAQYPQQPMYQYPQGQPQYQQMPVYTPDNYQGKQASYSGSYQQPIQQYTSQNQGYYPEDGTQYYGPPAQSSGYHASGTQYPVNYQMPGPSYQATAAPVAQTQVPYAPPATGFQVPPPATGYSLKRDMVAKLNQIVGVPKSSQQTQQPEAKQAKQQQVPEPPASGSQETGETEQGGEEQGEESEQEEEQEQEEEFEQEESSENSNPEDDGQGQNVDDETSSSNRTPSSPRQESEEYKVTGGHAPSESPTETATEAGSQNSGVADAGPSARAPAGSMIRVEGIENADSPENGDETDKNSSIEEKKNTSSSPSYAEKVSNGSNANNGGIAKPPNTNVAKKGQWVKHDDPWKISGSWTPKKTWKKNGYDNNYYHNRTPAKNYAFNELYKPNTQPMKVGETSNSDVKRAHALGMQETEPIAPPSVVDDVELPEIKDPVDDSVRDPSIPSTSSSSRHSPVEPLQKQKSKPHSRNGANKKKKNGANSGKKAEKVQRKKAENEVDEDDIVLNNAIAANEQIRAEEAVNRAAMELAKQKEEEDKQRVLEENRQLERARQKKLAEDLDIEQRKKYAEAQRLQEAYLNDIHLEILDENDELIKKSEIFAFDFKGGPGTATYCARVLNGVQNYVEKLVAEEKKNKVYTEEEIAELPKFRRMTMQANICATGTPEEIRILEEFMQSRVELHKESDVPGDSLRHVLYVALFRNFHPCLYTSILLLLTSDDDNKALLLLESDFIRMLLEMSRAD